jgi:hypothetical protein
MTILSGELLFVKPELVTDTGANGGRMGVSTVTSGLKNNIFPDVTQTQRESGLIRWRKLFAKVANADSLALLDARIHLTKPSNGDDRVTLAAGTQRDRQSELSGPREYGAASLQADVAAGASAFVAVLEDASQEIFSTGDMIWIGDGTNGEYFANVAIAKSGNQVAISLASGDQLANAYASGSAFVASVYSPGDVAGGVDSWTETSSAGAYDETGRPPEVDGIAGAEDDWTLTFTSSQAFTVAGAFTGALAAGGITQDYAPSNATHGRPYFTLRAAGWSGAWAAGDTIAFTTHPAAAPFWLKQRTPAGAQACNADVFEIAVAGESA